ncbi:MAG: DUF4381 family protein [Akkermansiaceae bacterium]
MVEGKQTAFELVENRDALDLVPSWELQWWWFVAFAVLIGLVVFFVSRLRKQRPIDPEEAERKAFQRAKRDLERLDENDDRAESVQVSIILRRYLADSKDEPALFQTHEEFIARHDALSDLGEDIKQSVGDFFAYLAKMKYSPKEGAVESKQLRERANDLLERMHAK